MGFVKDLAMGFMERGAAKKASAEIRQGRNKAVGMLNPFAEPGGQANTAIMDALGQGEPGAQDEAFQNFLNSTGFRSQLKAGSDAIVGNAASRGLINSGATLKRQTQFGQDLAQQGFNNFLGQLGGVANRGLSAAGQQASIHSGSTTRAADTTQEGRNAFTSAIGNTLGRVEDAASLFINPAGGVG